MMLFLTFLLIASASVSNYVQGDTSEEIRRENDQILRHASKERDTAPDSNFVEPSFIDQDAVNKDAVLGGLYNGKTDEYYISKSLWKSETIATKKRVFNTKSSETKFGYGRLRTEKMHNMNIRVSLQLSLLAGLISVDGSAKFFRETTVDENEEVINMYYKGTTRTEVIPANLSPDLPMFCSDEAVTHVVTSVTYGLNAYFQYTTRNEGSSREKSLQGNVSITFEAIVFSVTGKAHFGMNEREKHLLNNTNIVFRGDVLLEEIPTSYEKSIKAYNKITAILPKKPEDAQVVRVRLSPISNFCGKAHRKVNEIGQNVMKAVLSVFDEMEMLEMQINALLQRSITGQFFPLRNNMERYSTALLQHKRVFSKELTKLLPKIRSGDLKEDSLMKLYTSHSDSAFSKVNSRKFIKARLRETNALESLVNIVKTHADNIIKMDYIKANDVLIGLEADRYLMLNLNIMDPEETQRFLENRKINELNPWYDNTIFIEKIRSLLTPLREFARANINKAGELAYLVQLNKKQSSKNVEVFLLESRTNSTFLLPTTPEIIVTKSVLHDTVIFATGKAQTNKWIKKYQINYLNVIDNIVKIKRFDISDKLLTVEELDPMTLYRFTLQYYTDYGLSPETKEIDVVTKPSSPPTNLQLILQGENSLTIGWNKPLTIGNVNGKEFNINYEVHIKDEANKNINRVERNISSRRFEFLQLRSASKYRIAVAATFLPDNQTKTILSKESSEIFYTSPDRPQLKTVGQSSSTAVKLIWNIPKAANGDKIQKYEIHYIMMNAYGNKTLPETTRKLFYTAENTIKVVDLVPGTYYMFKVKAISKYGRSSYSNAVTEKTTFEQTQLGTLKSDFQQLLSSSEKRLKTELKKEMESNKKLLNAEILSSQGNTQKSLDKLDKETTKLTNKNSELQKKIDKIFGSNMKIKQSVLPAGYDQFSIYDIQWQSLHMAAAAACAGTNDFADSNYGHYVNNVVAQYPEYSCDTTCSEHSSSDCLAQVSILGGMGRKQGYVEAVGKYYRYSCEERLKHGEVEHEIDEKKIVDTEEFVMFCCCKGTF